MDEVLKLKAVVGERPVLAALSTHPGEDEKLISAWKTLKVEIPDLLLILAPRHPERGSDILTLCEEAKTYHRSEGGTPDPADQIWVCDTLGELGLWDDDTRAQVEIAALVRIDEAFRRAMARPLATDAVFDHCFVTDTPRMARQRAALLAAGPHGHSGTPEVDR